MIALSKHPSQVRRNLRNQWRSIMWERKDDWLHRNSSAPSYFRASEWLYRAVRWDLRVKQVVALSWTKANKEKQYFNEEKKAKRLRTKVLCNRHTSKGDGGEDVAHFVWNKRKLNADRCTPAPGISPFAWTLELRWNLLPQERYHRNNPVTCPPFPFVESGQSNSRAELRLQNTKASGKKRKCINNERENKVEKKIPTETRKRWKKTIPQMKQITKIKTRRGKYTSTN